MKYKPNWAQSKQRLTALWEHELVDRCCAAIPVHHNRQDYEAIDRFPKDMPALELERNYTDAETILAASRKKFEATCYFGEALPCVFPDFGTAGFVQYAGGKPTYAPDSIWFEHFLETDKPALLEFSDRQAFEKHVDLVRQLVQGADNDFFIAMPDNCGILDGLAAARGTQNLLMDLIDSPEFVQESTQKLIELYKNTTNNFFDAIRQNNDGGSSHAWMHTWSPKRHAQLQCDFSVMISPADFERFVLPELEELSAWLDKSIYHLDGQEQIRHLDLLLSVSGIDMIQWTPVAGQPPASDFLPIFEKIQKSGKGLVLILQSWEVEKVLNNLSARGLQMIVNDIHTEQEAADLLHCIEKWSKVR